MILSSIRITSESNLSRSLARTPSMIPISSDRIAGVLSKIGISLSREAHSIRCGIGWLQTSSGTAITVSTLVLMCQTRGVYRYRTVKMVFFTIFEEKRQEWSHGVNLDLVMFIHYAIIV